MRAADRGSVRQRRTGQAGSLPTGRYPQYAKGPMSAEVKGSQDTQRGEVKWNTASPSWNGRSNG